MSEAGGSTSDVSRLSEYDVQQIAASLFEQLATKPIPQVRMQPEIVDTAHQLIQRAIDPKFAG